MSSGWLYDDCTPLDRSVSEHLPFGIPAALQCCVPVCLLVLSDSACPLACESVCYLLSVSVCKRKPAGPVTFAERLRTVANKCDRPAVAGGLQESQPTGTGVRQFGFEAGYRLLQKWGSQVNN